mmetsp:Transcript_55303/g.135443  ORF Transcript_55303/g.135443 Transcript_55303/m.135443 type:complete len:241 (-) Transcript_55303:982-1704(-)
MRSFLGMFRPCTTVHTTRRRSFAAQAGSASRASRAAPNVRSSRTRNTTSHTCPSCPMTDRPSLSTSSTHTSFSSPTFRRKPTPPSSTASPMKSAPLKSSWSYTRTQSSPHPEASDAPPTQPSSSRSSQTGSYVAFSTCVLYSSPSSDTAHTGSQDPIVSFLGMCRPLTTVSTSRRFSLATHVSCSDARATSPTNDRSSLTRSFTSLRCFSFPRTGLPLLSTSPKVTSLSSPITRQKSKDA